MWVADWSSQTYLNRARSIVRQFKPAIIQAEFHIMGQYLLALEDCPAPQVVVEHEPGIRAAAYLRNVPPFLQEVTHRLEKLARMRYERALFHQVNAIVAFTAGDREAIQHISGGTPVFVIPPGIQIPERPLDPLGQLPPSLLFIGNFIHPPNVEAASILARDIFPLVQERFSETRLYIVGDQPPTEVRRFANANIVVTGRVSDVTHYLDQAALFVAPMRSGGGIRIKVMEAVIAGKAVVATRLAVEGLSLADGKEVAIADQDGEIVGRILDLLEHPDKRKTLAENARAWAIANLSWEKSIQRYEALYENLQ
jgi:glycosyltransferase involved in cell wall biosynthesis